MRLTRCHQAIHMMPPIRSLVMVALVVSVARAQVTPVADHHQHLFSPAIVALLATASGGPRPITAQDVMALLDSAGIRRALVLSVAYLYGSPARTVEDEYTKVKAENDWAGAEAAKFPDRLRAFCGFNPLKAYALEGLARCAKDRNLRHGIKLHFGNSDVQLDSSPHVEELRRVFRAANDNRMAIVVHMRASISRRRPYGVQQARIFLEQLLPVAPDIPVQIAHLAGTGPGYDDPPADSALGVLAEAVGRRDPRTKQLWLDVTTVVDLNISAANANLVARRISPAWSRTRSLRFRRCIRCQSSPARGVGGVSATAAHGRGVSDDCKQCGVISTVRLPPTAT